MSLLAPWGLLAGLLTVPLVVAYVLRSRRPRRTVASVLLWGGTDRAVAAAVPWQRFRPDRRFWLIAAAVLLGALALAGPAVRTVAAVGEHTIVVFDASGSMLADEDGPSRLELARRTAAELFARVPPGGLVSVVEAGAQGRVLESATTDRDAATRALDRVRATHGAADLADAFTLAAALERPGQETVTHLVTDGPVPAAAAVAAPAGLIVDVVGQDRPNLAVTRLQAVPAGAGQARVFVQVRNFGPVAADGDVTVRLDGVPIQGRRVALGPRATEDLVLTVGSGEGRILSAAVAPAGTDPTGAAAGDALPVDDTAWTVLAAPRSLRVLVAGPGNVFLDAALAAVPGVTVATAPAVPEELADIDLLIVDGVAAGALEVPTLLLAPATPPVGITVAGTQERPVLTYQDSTHELLADVDLSTVAVAAAQQVAAPALTAVASGPDGPLMLAGRLDGVPVVYLSFDLRASNLPLRVAWPVLVANTVAWLAGPPATAPAVAGALVTLTPPAGSPAGTLRPPDGPAVAVDPVQPRVRLDRVGVWELAWAPGRAPAAATPTSTLLAVNADPAESDLARGRPARAAPPGTPGAAAADVLRAGRRSVAAPLLVAVLVVLVADLLADLPDRGARGRPGAQPVIGARSVQGRAPRRSPGRVRDRGRGGGQGRERLQGRRPARPARPGGRRMRSGR